MIRHILLILFFITSSLFLNAQEPNVSIDGFLENNQEFTEISLQKIGRQVVEVAKATIVDGKFSINVNIEKTNYYRLYLAEKNFAILILSPGENIKFSAAATNMSMNVNVEGSKFSRQIYSTGMRVTLYDLKLDSLNKAYREIFKGNRSDPAVVALQTQYINTDAEYKAYLKYTIERELNSPAWLFFVEKLEVSKYLSTYVKLDSALMKNYPYIDYVQNLHSKVEKEKRLGIGGIPPDISLPDTAGNEISLYSFRGKVVLIDFWAGWCGPCRRENPNLVKLYAEYKDKGFEIFGVSLDRNRKSWVDAVDKDGITWTQVSDLKYWKSVAAKAYGVSAIPHAILIDREGRIVGNKLRGAALESKLKELFKED